MIGNIDKVWVGYATDQAVRLNAASGGIVTGSLIHLLENGFIDGAVVNISDPDQPPKGRSILAKTKDEILQSAKSIYCMTEIQRGLNLVKQDEKVKNFAVVGLPCQIMDLRKQMRKDKCLKEKVAFCVGLMCGHNVQAAATIEALKQSDIKIADVQEVCYRAQGWYPYFYTVKLKNGDVQNFAWPGSPLQKIWESLKYQPQRCKQCSDFAAESADVACCDAWLDEYRGNTKGYSIVLTHTKKGTAVIEKLTKAKVLSLKLTDASVIQRSQAKQLERKVKIRKEFKSHV